MKKLMLIAIVGLFAVTTAFAQARKPDMRGDRGRVEHRQPAPPPRHDRGISDDLAKARAITGIVRDSLGILGIGSPRVVVPPPPRIVTPAPIVRREVIITPAPIVTSTPVVQEVVVEKTVAVEKKISKIEPVAIGGKIFYKVTYENGEISYIESK